jgi:dienelactone hydrolase
MNTQATTNTENNSRVREALETAGKIADVGLDVGVLKKRLENAVDDATAEAERLAKRGRHAVEDIVDDTIAAMNWIFAHANEHGVGTERVVVSGHSAGGHLTAALFTTPLESLRFDAARIAGGVPISGLVDFEPLPLFSGNAEFRLDRESARRLDLYGKAPTIAAPLVVAVGGAESSEFQRQSKLLAMICPGRPLAPALEPSLLNQLAFIFVKSHQVSCNLGQSTRLLIKAYVSIDRNIS